MSIVQSTPVDIDKMTTGLEWAVVDLPALARLIAVIALGQADHAARIVDALEPSGAAYAYGALVADAKAQMMVKGATATKRRVSRIHRDGFLFECISWIVARQEAGARTFLKDPHIDATSHGLDGLIVELDATEPKVVNATICEDKCTVSPRALFRKDVMAKFSDHHQNKRARDLVANTAALIRESGIDGTSASRAAARVLDKRYRSYRAALTSKSIPDAVARAALFKGYSALDGIKRSQRIAATLPISGSLRGWFQLLADAVVGALDDFLVELGDAELEDDV